MSRSCSNCSLGCAVLFAFAEGGQLGASIDGAGELSCRSDAQGVLDASLNGRGCVTASISVGALSASLEGRARLAASIGGQASLTASVVCEIGEIPYLEIDPTYIWIIPDDLVSNDVYSNTTWGIN